MKRIFLCLLAVSLLAACGPNREKQIKAIAEHEQQLSTLEMSTQDAEFHEIIDLYRTFAHDFPDDSLAPVYMMRAADASISVGLPEQAVQLLDSVITLYQAREAYTYFVDNYPDHYLAPDTRKTLPYLGMTAEEMFEAIMNAAQEQ